VAGKYNSHSSNKCRVFVFPETDSDPCFAAIENNSAAITNSTQFNKTLLILKTRKLRWTASMPY
jgi:hypothetical protein